MMKPLLLDTGPLGRITHPRPNLEIVHWLQDLLRAGVPVIVPEIADYELRRNLILENLIPSLHRLDQLKEVLNYLPLTTETMLHAAQLWAQVRKQGYPTADPKSLDGDVFLAAQAIQADAAIATENINHLNRIVDARHWRDLP
ncbi:MAG TPA: PIN domain-containing protein [bacterium]|nr:PIN domain-containing protein [bacterium]